MPSSKILAFDDPYSYQAAIRAANVALVPTARGAFHAELVQADFRCLWIQRFQESAPLVKYVAMNRQRLPILFLSDPLQPSIVHGNLEASSESVVMYGAGVSLHHRSSAGNRYATMSLSPDDLARAAYAFAGRELPPPAETFAMKPSPHILSRLRRLHAVAGRLAADSPGALAHPEVARALEEALTHTMLRCLTENAPPVTDQSLSRRRSAMARLEELLAMNHDRPVYLSEICVAARASERTIRVWCQEHFGMGPVRYLWLRRMHLARQAMLLASSEGQTVTSIAMAHGFWELGRFSVAYRGLFGETPSATLGKPVDDASKSKNPQELPVFA
jgi:AraC-like DNA-binding protein